MIGRRARGQSTASSSTIIRIAVAGIAIGMAVMILTIGIVRGFQEEIRQKVIGFGSHLQVSYYNPQNTLGVRPMDLNQDFIEPIEAESSVKNVQAYAMKSGIITANGEIQGILSKGVGLDFNWDFFSQNLIEGELLNLRPNVKTDSIMLSKYVMDKLELELGQKIIVSYFQDDRERMRRFTIGGVYESGMQQFDGSIMLCDIRHVQRLNNWDSNQVAGFEVILNRFEDLQSLDHIILDHLGYEYTTIKITDQFADIFGWLELQDINVAIILTLMVLVSGINMISALLVMILERTNMIGLLKALGSLNKSIRLIFMVNAAYLIIIGVLIGNIIGLGLGWMQSEFELIKLDQKSYYVDHVPVLFEWSSVLLVNIGSIIACVLILILPSMVISKIDPVKTIRFN